MTFNSVVFFGKEYWEQICALLLQARTMSEIKFRRLQTYRDKKQFILHNSYQDFNFFNLQLTIFDIRVLFQ